MSPKWIYNSECYSLEFSEQSVQNYFLCAYQLRCDQLISLLAKQQVHFMTFRNILFLILFNNISYLNLKYFITSNFIWSVIHIAYVPAGFLICSLFTFSFRYLF